MCIKILYSFIAGKKGRERKRKKLNKEESKDSIPDNKGLETIREAPERENKDKQQQKKRKIQDKQQKSVSVSTVH